MKINKQLRRLPYPIKIIIKALFAPRYYARVLRNDIAAMLGRKAGGTHVIFIAGLPKSGTTWVENFVCNIPGYNPRVLNGSREMIRRHELSDEAFRHFPKYAYSAIKTHTNPSSHNIDVLVRNGINKVLIMCRDPRDVVVSMYYYVLKSNPWEPGELHYADYSKMTKEDALSHSMDVVINVCLHWIEGWRRIAKERDDIECMMLRYEDIHAHSDGAFHEILSFFNISLSKEEFGSVIDKMNNQQERKSSLMLPGTKSTKRKGKVGEWCEELSAAQQKKMKEACGTLLIELGYEKDMDWGVGGDVATRN